MNQPKTSAFSRLNAEAEEAARRKQMQLKACGTCDGDGRVEVCAVGHGSANCPCPTRRRECDDCNGTGDQPLSDEEIEALEAG